MAERWFASAHCPGVDGRITDPDAALDELVRLAAWLGAGAHEAHSPEQCDCGGFPGGGHTYGCSRLTRAERRERLADLVAWLDAHLSGGGALPTRWAADRTAADDRPVTYVYLPRGG